MMSSILVDPNTQHVQDGLAQEKLLASVQIGPNHCTYLAWVRAMPDWPNAVNNMLC